MNDLIAELHEIWSGEYDDIEFRYDPSCYGNTAWWYVTLVGRNDSWTNPHDANWVEYRWEFYDGDLSVAISDALEFARGLAALRPEDDS